MRIQLTDYTAPHPYPRPEILKPLSDNEITFSRFTSRLRRFRRDSVIHAGNQILWIIWQGRLNSKPIDTSAISHQLVLYFGPQVIAVAAAYCSSEKGVDIEEMEFRNLCWEFNSIKDSLSFRKYLKRVQVPAIARALQDLPAGSIFHRIPTKEADIRVISAFAFRARMITAQWEIRAGHVSNWGRNWLIFLELKNLCSSLETLHFDKLLETWLRIPPKSLVRGCFGFLGLATASIDKGVENAGFIDLQNGKIPPELAEKIGLIDEDLRILLDLIATDIDDYSKHSASIVNTPEPFRKYAREVNWLKEKPIVHLKNYSQDRHSKLLIPSPWALTFRLREFLLRETIYRIEEQSPEEYGFDNEKERKSPMTFLGAAYENYMRKAVAGRPEIQDLNKILPSGVKKADFIWIGSRYILVIECKITLKIDPAHNLTSTTAIIGHWKKAEKALTQGKKTLELLGSSAQLQRHGRNTILIVVTNDTFSEEGASFLMALHQWNLLGGSGFELAGILSSSDFEYFAHNSSADALGEVLEGSWNRLGGADNLNWSPFPEDMQEKLDHADPIPMLVEAEKDVLGDIGKLRKNRR